ncbi:hypothetical protein ACHGLA_03920 [Streptomyces sp. YH02]|uniref:hypothetical protein n=1 Tax=Streptomyces sp. YH02 TaxID=3256999 RepID=UPI0037581D82
MAVFSTLPAHVSTDRITAALQDRGLPPAEASATAEKVAEAVTGHPNGQGPTGDGPVARASQGAGDAIRRDFAEADQWVFYGMAIALAVAFLCALAHPGTRATERTPDS